MKRYLALALASQLAACASPLADRRVSSHWAMDVCAELDRDQWRACMREGLKVAPATARDAIAQPR